jgi:pyrimidine-nucleoside phosphorylase
MNKEGDIMNIVDLINKKRLNEKFNNEEIKFIINGYVNDEIKDYQMSSLLMAICINGMDNDEIYSLTDAMLNSGQTIDLSDIPGIKVDKHSTGGIGDKTTLIVGPLVASCNVPFAKMSGRGLGYTGGTIDKLESINGFKTTLTSDEFKEQIKKINVAIISQTENIVPADKKIYALRDVTGTTQSIPLIASSIMSKKIASGSDKILLDVKYGIGALMKKKEDAISLAKIMVLIGNKYGKETIALITNMDYPLGNMIGNGLEVKEAIDILSYKGNKDLKELCIVISSYIVSMSLSIELKEARDMVINNLINGNALNKFKELLTNQGGDINNISISKNIIEVRSNNTGYINDINALEIGNISMKLGSGRKVKDDAIDYGVGIEIVKHVGEYINANDVIARIYINKIEANIEEVLNAFKIEGFPKQKEQLILGIIKV